MTWRNNCPYIHFPLRSQEFCQTTLKSYNEANEKILVPEDPIKLFVQTSDKIEYSFQTEKQKSQDDSVIKIDLLEPSEKKMSPEKIINEKQVLDDLPSAGETKSTSKQKELPKSQIEFDNNLSQPKSNKNKEHIRDIDIGFD